MSLGDSVLDVAGAIYDVTPAGFVINKVSGAVLGPTVLSAMDQAEDIDAIHDFFVREQPHNETARRLKDDWMRWAGSLSWYQKHVDTNVGAEAYNRRNEFMRANVQSKEELEKTNEFLKKVPAFDPVTGNPNFVDSKGDRVLQPKPLIPTPYKVAGVIGAAAVAALVVLKKLTIL